jgi:predicted Zn-dependent protease
MGLPPFRGISAMSYQYRSRSWWWRLIPIAIALVSAGVLMVRGCQEGPGGRNQIVAFGPEEEARLGAQAFREVLSESKVVRSGPLPERVQRVGRRLAVAAESDNYRTHFKLKPEKFVWEFQVVDSKQVNAFCLPGGKVVVYTGILPVCETEAGLATVMGHEIAHALAHHGAERMAHQQLAQIGQLAVASSFSDLDPQQRRQILSLYNVGSQYGLLKYSRDHESEADYLGVVLMAAAGYDPKEAVRFWTRMDKQSGGSRTSEFSSTHPSHETRVRDLENWQPEAKSFFNKVTDRPNGQVRLDR